MAIGIDMEFEGNVKPTSIEQAGFEPDLWASRITEIPSNLTKRYDYTGRTDDQPLYVGYGAKGLAEGTDGWLLYKCAYDASQRILSIKIYYGNWTARGTYIYE